MPESDATTRAAVYGDMSRVLAQLHSLDWKRAGLAHWDLGSNYLERQVECVLVMVRTVQ